MAKPIICFDLDGTLVDEDGRIHPQDIEILRTETRVHFIPATGPHLRRGRAPVICNVGSVLGHRAVPNKSEYCASKFALHGLSDSIRAELAADGIQVTIVSPSTTRSEFFDSLIETDPEPESKSIGSWAPERVARTTLAAIEARRSEVICSLAGKAFVYADRFAPPIVNAVLSRRES